MGIYEIVYDCEDGDFCIMGDFCIPCKKHKHAVGMKCKYNLDNFFKKYLKSGQILDKTYFDIEIIDSFYLNKITLTQSITFDVIKIKNAPLFNFDESKCIYFSDYNNEPSFKYENGNLIIIDQISYNYINYPEPYRGKKYKFDWETCKMIESEEYKKQKEYAKAVENAANHYHQLQQMKFTLK